MRAQSADRRSERGAVAVMVALLAAVLIGFLALAMNVGHATSVRGELENAADAAALAAARELDAKLNQGSCRAFATSEAIGRNHTTDATHPVSITRTDVAFCHWDRASNRTTWCLDAGVDPSGDPPPFSTPGAKTELAGANAVQVTARRQGGDALPVWFASFLGQQADATMSVSAVSTAVGGGPCESRDVAPLVAPLALADCRLVDGEGSPSCGAARAFSDSGNTDLAPVRRMSSHLSAGDLISIQSGGNVRQAVYDQLLHLVGSSVTVPVVEPSSGCPTTRFSSRDYPVLGFASVSIDQVTGGCHLNRWGRRRCSISQIQVTVSCPDPEEAPPDGSPRASAGCGFYGLLARTSQLVPNR